MGDVVPRLSSLLDRKMLSSQDLEASRNLEATHGRGWQQLWRLASVQFCFSRSECSIFLVPGDQCPHAVILESRTKNLNRITRLNARNDSAIGQLWMPMRLGLSSLYTLGICFLIVEVFRFLLCGGIRPSVEAMLESVKDPTPFSTRADSRPCSQFAEEAT